MFPPLVRLLYNALVWQVFAVLNRATLIMLQQLPLSVQRREPFTLRVFFALLLLTLPAAVSLRLGGGTWASALLFGPGLAAMILLGVGVSVAVSLKWCQEKKKIH